MPGGEGGIVVPSFNCQRGGSEFVTWSLELHGPSSSAQSYHRFMVWSVILDWARLGILLGLS